MCQLVKWQKTWVDSKGGDRVVATTTASCVEDVSTTAVLELQAGFRPYFAAGNADQTFLDTIVRSVEGHAKNLRDELGINHREIIPWLNAFLQNIREVLEAAEEPHQFNPLTPGIDFIAGKCAFKKALSVPRFF